MHKPSEFHSREPMPGRQAWILIRTDDVQNAVRASDVCRSTKVEENWILDAVGFRIEEMVAGSVAVAALKGFAANVIANKVGQHD